MPGSRGVRVDDTDGFCDHGKGDLRKRRSQRSQSARRTPKSARALVTASAATTPVERRLDC